MAYGLCVEGLKQRVGGHGATSPAKATHPRDRYPHGAKAMQGHLRAIPHAHRTRLTTVRLTRRNAPCHLRMLACGILKAPTTLLRSRVRLSAIDSRDHLWDGLGTGGHGRQPRQSPCVLRYPPQLSYADRRYRGAWAARHAGRASDQPQTMEHASIWFEHTGISAPERIP